MDGTAPLVEHVESAVVTQGGDLRTIAWHHTVLHDADGAITGTLSSGEDVTERHRAEQQVTYLAYHDALTGLANRTLLEEHLKLALARSRRTGAGVALLQLDLDDFKLVNDSLGPPRRRRADLPARDAPAGVGARDRPARPHGRRRLPRSCSPTCTTTPPRRPSASPRSSPRASPSRSWSPTRSSRSRRRSGSRSRRATRATRRRCSPTPTRRCTTPRRPPAAAGPSTRRPAATRSSGSPWPRRLRRALNGEEFQLHYQPIFDTSTRELTRRRGAAALARPRARRARAAERVHPRGRGDRADRADRRLGDRRGLRAAGRLGRARHAAADLGQRLAAPAAPARLHRARQAPPARERRRARRGSPSS